jgi:hypothetical protein
MVEKEWLSVSTGGSPMGNWQNKIKTFEKLSERVGKKFE